MSLSQSSFSSEGRFGAEAIVKVMDGIRPRDVGQVFDSAIGLAINLEMARLIYWDPPFEILRSIRISKTRASKHGIIP